MTVAARTLWARSALFVVTVTAVALVHGSRDRFEVRPGGAVFLDEVLAFPLLVLVVGALLAVWRPLIGAAIAGFAVAALAVLGQRHLRSGSAAILVLAVSAPVIAWAVADIAGGTTRKDADPDRRRTLIGLGAAAAAVVVGGATLGRYIYGRIWGPTHPASAVEPSGPTALDWVWSGRLTSSSCAVRTRPNRLFDKAQLVVATDANMIDARRVPVAGIFDRVLDFQITDLEPSTEYFYAVELDGELDRERSGSFRTAPAGREPMRLAFASCARIGSNGAVFDAVREHNPLMYVCLGDFHYADNFVDDVTDYRRVFDIQLSQPGQTALYLSTPIAYVWDDHDYGPNDSNKNAIGRPAAMVAYREYVPHYDLAGPSAAIFQAFSLGTVRVILTDARASRDPQDQEDTSDKSVLGLEQRAWLLDELTASADSHDLVIWVNPIPWVADAKPGDDTWGGYSLERALIADHIADQGIHNLLMVCGDAHMLAIDDGSHTNFSSTAGPGFPLVHVAALDRPGSTKGGPFTHGPIPGGGHFGIVDLQPSADGSRLDVEIACMNWRREKLLTHGFSVPTNPAAAT